MSQTPLQPDTNFVVKEDKFLNLLIAGLCFFFFVISIVTFSGQFIDYFSIPFFLGPTLLFVYKAFQDSTLILINKNGIYYGKKLITNWKNFNKAQLKEVEKIGQVSDNFQIEIKYYSEVRGGYLHKHIKLGNTQSQSEESIMGAIRYFQNLYADGKNDLTTLPSASF